MCRVGITQDLFKCTVKEVNGTKRYFETCKVPQLENLATKISLKYYILLRVVRQPKYFQIEHDYIKRQNKVAELVMLTVKKHLQY